MNFLVAPPRVNVQYIKFRLRFRFYCPRKKNIEIWHPLAKYKYTQSTSNYINYKIREVRNTKQQKSRTIAPAKTTPTGHMWRMGLFIHAVEWRSKIWVTVIVVVCWCVSGIISFLAMKRYFLNSQGSFQPVGLSKQEGGKTTFKSRLQVRPSAQHYTPTIKIQSLF